MDISLIVAHDKKYSIGYQNSLPWILKDDLKIFKQKTQGNVVFMGMNTFKSLNNKPLPNRLNIVLTKNSSLFANSEQENLYFVPDIYTAIDIAESKQYKEFFIIGGASIYKQFIDCVDTMYITEIDGIFQADTYFPEYNKNDFKVVESIDFEKNEMNSHKFTFKKYVRK